MKRDTYIFHPTVHEDDGISPKVLRITDPNDTCNHLYFTSRSFTPDDSKVVFISDRDGGRNLYHIDMETFVVTQLTEGRELDYFPYIDRGGKYIYFGEKNCMYKVDMENCDEELICDASALVGHDVFKCSGAYQSWDGKKLVCFFEADPEYGLIVIDLVTGESKIILRGDQPVRHCQFCPYDHNLIVYAHEGNWSTIQARMWFINADGSNHRRVRDHDDGLTEAVGHESWGNTSRRLFYKVKRGAPIYVCSFDVDANKETELFELTHNHGVATVDDKYFIADDRTGPMHIVKIETGEKHALCYPLMSWRKGWSRFHPHPTMSNKGDRVVYSTDNFGNPGVFVAEVPKF